MIYCLTHCEVGMSGSVVDFAFDSGDRSLEVVRADLADVEGLIPFRYKYDSVLSWDKAIDAILHILGLDQIFPVGGYQPKMLVYNYMRAGYLTLRDYDVSVPILILGKSDERYGE